MKNLLIIGGGSMGSAIAEGIVNKTIISRSGITIIEKNKTRINYLKKFRYVVSNNIIWALKKTRNNLDAIIIAVKPQDIKDTLRSIGKEFPNNILVISIAAGIKIKYLASLLPQEQPIARVMPNTPCQVGEGMSVLAFNKHVSKSHKITVNKIFNSIGKTEMLDEKYFDLIGSLVGSGPAYFCYIIESLTEIAKRHNIKENTARKLILQTALGTLILLSKNKILPEELRKKVTSPKGITEAAINVFKKLKINEIFYDGVKAAIYRSRELGK